MAAASRRLRRSETWLYDFARHRLADAPEAQRAAIAWEALAFAKGVLGAAGSFYTVDDDVLPPTWAEVTRAHTQLWARIFGPLKAEGECEAQWAGSLMLRPDGTLREYATTLSLGFLDGFLHQAVE